MCRVAEDVPHRSGFDDAPGVHDGDAIRRLGNHPEIVGDEQQRQIHRRFHVAQHSFLSHMHFSVGQGRAALEDVGNQADSLEIEGGDYGIISVRTSPAWQFLLMDSRLSGQRMAAIHTQEVGMTLIRDIVERTQIAVEIPPNMPEQLYGRDLLLRQVRTGVALGDTTSQHHQVTLENIRCSHVGHLLQACDKAWQKILRKKKARGLDKFRRLVLGVSAGHLHLF